MKNYKTSYCIRKVGVRYASYLQIIVTDNVLSIFFKLQTKNLKIDKNKILPKNQLMTKINKTDSIFSIIMVTYKLKNFRIVVKGTIRTTL